MALINSDGRYIKLDKDDNFEIYISKEAREQIKNSTPAEVVLAKYTEIYTALHSEEYAEFRYYDPENYWALVHSWEEEYQRYANHIQQGTYNELETYPLMAEYYPDVANSIPKIWVRGSLGETFSTATEAYEDAKLYKLWGETVDA